MFGLDSGLSSEDQIWYWKELATLVALVAALSMLVPLGRLLLRLRWFRTLVHPIPEALPRPQGRGRLVFWAVFAVSGLIACVSYIPLAEWSQQLFVAASTRQQTWFFPQRMNNAVMMWAVLNGLVGFLLFFLTHRFFGRKHGVEPAMWGTGTSVAELWKTMVLGVTLFGAFFGLLFLVHWLFHVDYRFVFLGVRAFQPILLPLLPMYAPLIFVFFLANSLRVNGAMRFRGSSEQVNLLLAGVANAFGLILILLVQVLDPRGHRDRVLDRRLALREPVVRGRADHVHPAVLQPRLLPPDRQDLPRSDHDLPGLRDDPALQHRLLHPAVAGHWCWSERGRSVWFARKAAPQTSMRYGIIGNCAYNALLLDGSVEWMCWPRMDSSFVFGPMLDRDKGGTYRVELVDAEHVEQHYIPNTNVLRTEFRGPRGAFELIDFAPRFQLYDRSFKPTSLVRVLRLLHGDPLVRVTCKPTYDYGRTTATSWLGSNHIQFRGLPVPLRLTTNIPLTYVHEGRPFVLSANKHLVLTWGQPLEQPLEETAESFMERTIRDWRRWVKHTRVPRDYQEHVIRSALVLKLHQYEDTGAIIAATTTSAAGVPRQRPQLGLPVLLAARHLLLAPRLRASRSLRRDGDVPPLPEEPLPPVG